VRCILYEIKYFRVLFHSYRAINFGHVSLLNAKELFLLYIGIFVCIYLMPVPVAARSEAWFYGHLPAETVGSNSTGTWKNSSCECCVLSGGQPCIWLLHCPEESYRCGASECDGEASIMRRPCPTRGCSVIKTYLSFKISKYLTIFQCVFHSSMITF
jgi:hypothetical protein